MKPPECPVAHATVKNFIKKVLEKKGIKDGRVSDDAAEKVREYLNEFVYELAKVAKELAKMGGRETITGKDVEKAFESLIGKK